MEMSESGQPPLQGAEASEGGDELYELVRDEAALGESAAAKSVSRSLLALGRAARAYLFYEPENEALRVFLQDLSEQVQLALEHGDIELTFHPWSILRGDEKVYHEEDRERSLAFRLYRDGVRRLTIKRGVSWDELVRLLGVISVRFTGIRQQEDDIVTLFWRAEFTNIEVASVQGFATSDDEAEEVHELGFAPRNQLQAEILSAPFRFVHPPPRLTASAEVFHRPVGPDDLERLRWEAGDDAVPLQSLRLAQEILIVVNQAADTVDLETVVAFFQELRLYLLGRESGDELIQFVRLLMTAKLQDQSVRERLVSIFTSEGAMEVQVELLLRREDGSQQVRNLIEMLPGDSGPIVLGLLADRWEGEARKLGIELVAGAKGPRLDAALGVIRMIGGRMAAELLGIVAKHHPERAGEVALACLEGDDVQVQRMSIAVLRSIPYCGEIGRALVKALKSNDAKIRTGAAILLANNREGRAFGPIAECIEAATAQGIEAREAEVFGIALHRVDPERALSTFRDWIRTSKLTGTLRPSTRQLWWIATFGLQDIGGDEAIALIEDVRKKGDKALQHRCDAAIAAIHQQDRERDR